eukprot:s758_g15.t1
MALDLSLTAASFRHARQAQNSRAWPSCNLNCRWKQNRAECQSLPERQKLDQNATLWRWNSPSHAAQQQRLRKAQSMWDSFAKPLKPDTLETAT